MNNNMRQADYFDILLRNFRLLEACGFVGALVNKEIIEEDRGKHIEDFLRSYNYIIVNNMLNSQGIHVLKIGDCPYDDINSEKRRLIRLIESCSDDKKSLILNLLSAYISLTNEDGISLERHYSSLIEKIEEYVYLDAETINDLGTYDCFNYLSEIVMKINNINKAALSVLRDFEPRIRLDRSLSIV